MAAAIDERYILLGLRLGRHVDGLVDGYFGPAELKATVESEEQIAPAALLDEANALFADVASVSETERQRWLTGQVRGLICVAEMLSGTEVPWLEAVRRCYGIDVEIVPEERFAAVRARLDEALPGNGDVAERLDAWNQSQNVPAASLLPVLRALVGELRERTQDLVDLPEDEVLEAETVVDKPWSAYNWYLGGRASRIELNTDLPIRSYALPALVAHECYPGHHTEHACKEARLVDELGRTEASILLIHTPECLVSEGIAQLAIEQALGEEWLQRAQKIVEPFEIPFDADIARVVVDANRELGAVGVNIAYFASERGWTTAEAVEYHRRWHLSTEERARKAVEFNTHPMWSIYVPNYTEGFRLVRKFVNGSDDVFRRLLTEQLTTADLL